jgi:hypothetical protein
MGRDVPYGHASAHRLAHRLRLLVLRKSVRDFYELMHLGSGTAERICASLILGGASFGGTLVLASALGLSVVYGLLLAGTALLVVIVPSAILILGPPDSELEIAVAAIRRQLAKARQLEPARDALGGLVPPVPVARGAAGPLQAAPPRPHLQACPDCGGSVSRRARACPHCGCPIDGRSVAPPGVTRNQAVTGPLPLPAHRPPATRPGAAPERVVYVAREGLFLQTLNCGCAVVLLFIGLVVLLVVLFVAIGTTSR